MKRKMLLTVALVLVLGLAACGSAEPAATVSSSGNAPTAVAEALPAENAGTPSGFPTGRFLKVGSKDYGLLFKSDGSFEVFSGEETFVRGTYKAEGNVLTETSNDGGCNTDVSFTYAFDGTNLTFKYVGNADEDSGCFGRYTDFNDVTYTLSQ